MEGYLFPTTEARPSLPLLCELVFLDPPMPGLLWTLSSPTVLDHSFPRLGYFSYMLMLTRTQLNTLQGTLQLSRLPSVQVILLQHSALQIVAILASPNSLCLVPSPSESAWLCLNSLYLCAAWKLSQGSEPG